MLDREDRSFATSAKIAGSRRTLGIKFVSMKPIWISILLLGLCANIPAQNGSSSNPDVAPDLTLEAITRVDPEFPAAAQGKVLSGEVVVSVEIDESGDVSGVHLVGGNSMLADAAISTAKQWKFKPFTRDGKP